MIAQTFLSPFGTPVCLGAMPKKASGARVNASSVAMPMGSEQAQHHAGKFQGVAVRRA